MSSWGQQKRHIPQLVGVDGIGVRNQAPATNGGEPPRVYDHRVQPLRGLRRGDDDISIAVIHKLE